MDKDQIAKIVCYGLGCVFVYLLLLSLLPYVSIGIAIYTFGYLVMKDYQNNRRNRH